MKNFFSITLLALLSSYVGLIIGENRTHSKYKEKFSELHEESKAQSIEISELIHIVDSIKKSDCYKNTTTWKTR